MAEAGVRERAVIGQPRVGWLRWPGQAWTRFAPHAAPTVIFVIVGFLALYPVGMLLVGSFLDGRPGLATSFTLKNYIDAYSDPMTYRLFLNTLVIIGLKTAIAVSVAILFAWVITRTDTPFRGTLEILLLVPFFIPAIFQALGWVILLSPRAGAINVLLRDVLGLEFLNFNIYSAGGLVWVLAVDATPTLFLLIVSAFRAMDAALEESALASGANHRQVFSRITLPLVLPAVLGATTLTFIKGMEYFELPVLIGMPGDVYVFTSQIYYVTRIATPPRYGMGTALGVSFLALTMLLVVLQRRALKGKEFFVVTGKAYRPLVVELGALRWIALAVCATLYVIMFVLPLSQVLIGSFQGVPGVYSTPWTLRNFDQVLGNRLFWSGLKNSFLLAGSAAALTMAICLLVGYVIQRTRFPLRRTLDVIAWVPWTVPGIVMGLGLLWAYIFLPDPFNIYGTVWLVVVAFVTIGLPLGVRLMAGGLVQIEPALEESATVSGAGRLEVIWRIILPLMKPALIAGAIILFASFIRNISTVVLLSTQTDPLISIILFDYFFHGHSGPAAALSVLLTIFVIAPLALLRRLGAFEIARQR